jgi:hypothetical protein
LIFSESGNLVSYLLHERGVVLVTQSILFYSEMGLWGQTPLFPRCYNRYICMEKEIEKKGLEHIQKIEHELGEIKDRTPGSKRTFFLGILQGMGIVIGSLLGLALLGWILSFLGIIPGLDQLANYIRTLMEQK